MENKTYIQCYICMDNCSGPVIATCGHTFCWQCLKLWLNNKTVHTCPVCKNGIDLNKIISIYGSDNSLNDDRPKPERVEPVTNRNRSSFFTNFISGLGVGGTQQDDVQFINIDYIYTNSE